MGIVLAYLLPVCHIIMIENNEESHRRAAQRVKSIGLKNVTLYQSNIDYFTGNFDIGVSRNVFFTKEYIRQKNSCVALKWNL